MLQIKALTLVLACSLCTHAFHLARNVPRRRIFQSSSSGQAIDLFKAEKWPAIKAVLDKVPVFAVCVENQPLKVNVNRKPLALFFVDLAMAQNEMKIAQKALPKAVIDLVQFPLGEAFVGWYQETARIMPTVEALRASGAPRDLAPIDSMVPLFAANLQIISTDGTPKMPLFFVEAEAKAALEAARSKGVQVDQELMKLPLQKAVFLLATDPEAPDFEFMTPDASADYIARVMGKQ